MVPISTTSLRAMDECERGFASRYVHKHGHGDSKATFRGNDRHDEYQKMVYEPGFIPIPPADMTAKEKRSMDVATRYVDNFLNALRKTGGVLKPEVWVAINRDGSPSKYGAPTPPYIRVKTDLYWRSPSGRTLGTWDWKSGSWVPEEGEQDYTQTRLTALALLKQKPEVQAVIGGIIYTQHEKTFPITIHRREIEHPGGEMQDLLAKLAQYEEKQRIGDWSKATRGRWCQYCADTACPFNPTL